LNCTICEVAMQESAFFSGYSLFALKGIQYPPLSIPSFQSMNDVSRNLYILLRSEISVDCQ